MRFKNKLLTFSALSSLLIQSSLYAGKLFPNMPDDVENEIIAKTKIIDSKNAELVSKNWNQKFNQEIVWKEYAQRIPGSSRLEETGPIELQGLQGAQRIKKLVQLLMRPKLEIICDHAVGLAISEDGRNVVGVMHQTSPIFNSGSTIFINIQNNPLKQIELIGAYQSEDDGINDKVMRPNGISNDGKVTGSYFTLDNEYGCILEEEMLTFSSSTDEYKAISSDGKNVMVDSQNSKPSPHTYSTHSGEKKPFLDLNHDVKRRFEFISTDWKTVAGTFEKDNQKRFFTYRVQEDLITEILPLEEWKFVEVKGVSSSGNRLVVEHSNGSVFSRRRVSTYFKAEGFISLKSLDENLSSEVKGVSENAQQIIGTSDVNNGAGPFSMAVVWLDKELFSLQNLFNKDLSPDMVLYDGKGISADGTIIVGTGVRSKVKFAFRGYIPRYDIFKEEGFDLLKP